LYKQSIMSVRRLILLSFVILLAGGAWLWLLSRAPQSSEFTRQAVLVSNEPIDDVIIGNANAPVSIVEYASMGCPHCAAFATQVFPALRERFIDTGKANFVMRDFPLDTASAGAAMLGRCVPAKARQPLLDVLFEQQNEWARGANAKAALLRISRLAGLSEVAFLKCLSNQTLLDQIIDGRKKAEQLFDVHGTPTFFINAKRYSGAFSVDEMSKYLEGVLVRP